MKDTAQFPKLLDEIDLSLDLAGTEGHDKNYVSRVRSQYLYAQHQSLINQIQFADAKAAALITLLGILLLRGPTEFTFLTEFPVGAAFNVLSATAIAFALFSLYPRVPPANLREKMAKIDRWSWPSLAHSSLPPHSYARFMQTSEVSQLIYSVALSNSFLSSILLKKFRYLQVSFFTASIAVILVCIELFYLAGQSAQ